MTLRDADDVAMEQARRLAECWRESAPSESDVRRLRARLAVRSTSPRRPRVKLLAVALAQGFVFGGVTLAAAAWITGRVLPSLGRPPAGESGERRESATPRHPFAAGAAPSAPAPNDPPGAVAVFGDPKTEDAEKGAPRASVDRGTLPQVPARPHAAPPAPSPSEKVQTSREETPADNPPPPAEGPWARVAQALSASDWLRADRALVELASTSGDPATRDAADLARAELWIAHGQGAALRASVARLAQHGSTALIRRRATLLLDRLP